MIPAVARKPVTKPKNLPQIVPARKMVPGNATQKPANAMTAQHAPMATSPNAADRRLSNVNATTVPNALARTNPAAHRRPSNAHVTTAPNALVQTNPAAQHPQNSLARAVKLSAAAAARPKLMAKAFRAPITA